MSLSAESQLIKDNVSKMLEYLKVERVTLREKKEEIKQKIKELTDSETEAKKKEQKIKKLTDKETDLNVRFFDAISKKFSQLKEKIPSLFNMILDLDNPDEFEMNRLDDMLYLRDRVRSNKISNERASAHIGQKYFNDYVKPKVDMTKETNHPTTARQPRISAPAPKKK